MGVARALVAVAALAGAGGSTLASAPLQELPLKLGSEQQWIVDTEMTQPEAAASVVSWSFAGGSAQLVINKAAHTYYGYELRTEPGEDGERVSFAPLSSAFVAHWLESGWNHVCPGCPPPQHLSLDYSRLPSSRTFRDGDSFRLELPFADGGRSALTQTFRFKKQSLPSGASIRMELALLVVNGRPMRNLTSCEGDVVYFFYGKQGRYLVSGKRRDGFREIGVLVGNELQFAWGGDDFRWQSSSPVVHLPGAERDAVVKTRLWVRFEPEWKPSATPDAGTYGSGVLTGDLWALQ
jgi:hypothetical protein